MPRIILKTLLQTAQVCTLLVVGGATLATAETKADAAELGQLLTEANLSQLQLVDVLLAESLKHGFAYRDAILAVRSTEGHLNGDPELLKLEAQLNELWTAEEKVTEDLIGQLEVLKGQLPEGTVLTGLKSTLFLMQREADKEAFETWLAEQSN